MSDRLMIANGTVWPSPSGRLNDVAWRMIHCRSCVDADDMMFAATVMEAYSTLILHPAFTLQNVQKIVSGIRKAHAANKEQP